MKKCSIHNAEVTAWAAEEAGRIAFGFSERFHAILCDPPYGLSFMNKEWDEPGSPVDFENRVTVWGESLKPLLYPGALVFMFGGTRMWNRIASGMQNAGYDLRDTLMWLYGQGFPKGLDTSKLIDSELGAVRTEIVGYKAAGIGTGAHHGHHQRDNGPAEKRIVGVTAPATEQAAPWTGHKTFSYKPAWEPVLCFRAPDEGMNYAELALKFGSGSLNIDGGRYVGEDDTLPKSGIKKEKLTRQVYGGFKEGEWFYDASMGRYPSNLFLTCTCEQTTETTPHTDPNCPIALLDAQGEARDVHPSGSARPDYDCQTAENAFGFGGRPGSRHLTGHRFGDSGGVSRFFYCAKADRWEREAGLEAFPKKLINVTEDGGQTIYSNLRCVRCKKVKTGNPYCVCPDPIWNELVGSRVANNHPTVKPIDVIARYLAVMLLPPPLKDRPRRILVPFSGVGSEVIGCLLAGWDEVVGVEMDEEFCRIAQARVDWHNAHALEAHDQYGEKMTVELHSGETVKILDSRPKQEGLFSGLAQ